MTAIKRFFIGFSCIAAFVSAVGAFSIIESPEFTIELVVPWILLFLAFVFIAVVLDRPTRISRHLVAAHVCLLAWKYLHNFTYKRNAKYCAVMKHRYRTYRNLYRRVIEYYKYEVDDGEGIFQ